MRPAGSRSILPANRRRAKKPRDFIPGRTAASKARCARPGAALAGAESAARNLVPLDRFELRIEILFAEAIGAPPPEKFEENPADRESRNARSGTIVLPSSKFPRACDSEMNIFRHPDLAD